MWPYWKCCPIRCAILGVELRRQWNDSGEIIAWIPLPLLGIPPWVVFAAFSVNLIYRFWAHTQRIDRLWRPIEYIFNTPSHHRVHHGAIENIWTATTGWADRLRFVFGPPGWCLLPIAREKPCDQQRRDPASNCLPDV